MHIAIPTLLAAALLAPAVTCAPQGSGFDFLNMYSPAASKGSNNKGQPPKQKGSTPADPTSSNSSTLPPDAQEALKRHNLARQEVGVQQPLSWDASLAADAQVYGKKLVSMNKAAGTVGELTHSDDNPDGENLYYQYGPETEGPMAHAAAMWIDEKHQYTPGKVIVVDETFELTGHYTQVVWNTTTLVGIAAVDDSTGGTFVVARYREAGNIISLAPY